MSDPTAIALHSGGLDSATTLAVARGAGRVVDIDGALRPTKSGTADVAGADIP